MQNRVEDTFVALKQFLPERHAKPGAGKSPALPARGQNHDQRDPAALLGSAVRVLSRKEHFNNAYGLPLTLLQVDESHQAAVPGDGHVVGAAIEASAEFAAGPDVRVPAFRRRSGVFFVVGESRWRTRVERSLNVRCRRRCCNAMTRVWAGLDVLRRDGVFLTYGDRAAAFFLPRKISKIAELLAQRLTMCAR